jgi:multicomponent Na+:H+ antiporter subunit D
VSWAAIAAHPAWPALAVTLPAGAAVLVLLLGRRSLPWLPVAAGLAQLLVAAMLAVAVATAGATTLALGGWPLPLGIALRVDALAVLFVALSALLALVVTPAAWQPDHADGAAGARAFWPLWLMLQSGLSTAFLSADLFNLYVALEVTTLAGVALVAAGGTAALEAQLRYLLQATLGSMLYLMGVALIYAERGALDIALAAGGAPTLPLLLAALLLTAGLLIKTAVWPLHVWLPPAHGAAPPPVSALLSGLVVKASLYLVIRLWFELFASVLPPPAWWLLGYLGAGAVLWGSLLALRQERLKLMIAYSTVAQLGYMLFVFPLAGAGGGGALAAWQGSLLQLLAHAIAKAAMFLAAGALIAGQGGDSRGAMAGATRRMPMPMMALGLAGLSILGLPPSGGFLAKWLLLRTAIESGAWLLAAVLIGGGLMAAGYLFRFLLPALRPVPAGGGDRPLPPDAMAVAALVLALLSVTLGLATAPVLAVLAAAAPPALAGAAQ